MASRAWILDPRGLAEFGVAGRHGRGRGRIIQGLFLLLFVACIGVDRLVDLHAHGLVHLLLAQHRLEEDGAVRGLLDELLDLLALRYGRHDVALVLLVGESGVVRPALLAVYGLLFPPRGWLCHGCGGVLVRFHGQPGEGLVQRRPVHGCRVMHAATGLSSSLAATEFFPPRKGRKG